MQTETRHNSITGGQNAENKLISAFIHELNLSRRHLQTYPSGHPMIATAIEKVLELIDPLFATYQSFTLGVAKDALMFEQQWLGKDNPSYRDFANTLFELDIAAIHFNSKPTINELLILSDLMNSDRQIIKLQGGINAQLQQLKLSSIEITPVNYAAFKTTDLDPEQQKELAESLWENFLNGLLGKSQIGQELETKNLALLDAKAIAHILNEHCNLSNQELAEAVADFVEQLRLYGDNLFSPGQQFADLIAALNPDLRSQFINSTFQQIAEQQDQPQTTLHVLPKELIEAAMLQLNKDKPDLSATIFNLLGKLNMHYDPTSGQITSGEQNKYDAIGERLKTLFREEDKGKFTPDSYQATLDHIVLKNDMVQLNNPETTALRNTLLNSTTEGHNCAIIFNLLQNDQLQPEQAHAMQRNLIDLAHFFLETGNFKDLSYLHDRLNHYLYDFPQMGQDRTGQLQEALNEPAFHQEVLDNLSRWDEEKQREITAYLKMTGAAITGSLIERLATTDDKSLRRLYLTSLASLGQTAHQEIYQNLNDQRWYLVRNLLAALRLQNDPIDVSQLEKLEKHPHLRVNQELLQLLFKFDQSGANELIRKQLGSDDPEIRLHAVKLADMSRDPAIVKKLLGLLERGKLNDETYSIKQQIIKSLNGIGSAEALPTLEKLLKPGRLLTAKRKLELQKEILANLDKYPFEQVKPLLQGIIRTKRKPLCGLATEKLRHLLRK